MGYRDRERHTERHRKTQRQKRQRGSDRHADRTPYDIIRSGANIAHPIYLN